MDEFASGTLVAAVLRSLAADGLPAPGAPPVGGALVPLAVKRRLLADITRDHGPEPLLRVGAHLLDGPPDPVLAALRASAGPADLLDRWRRLERFTHSRHRVLVRTAHPSGMTLHHTGPPGSPPEPAENALIRGLLTALLSAVGARDLTVDAEDGALWRFTWSTVDVPPPPPPSGAGLAARTRGMLSSDPARRWTLDAVAAELAVPTRTLQRRLSSAWPERGFTGLLAAVRADTAAGLLRSAGPPLSVIGFTCGYADQPHFTREFRRRTAMTPGQFRTAFARPIGES